MLTKEEIKAWAKDKVKHEKLLILEPPNDEWREHPVVNKSGLLADTHNIHADYIKEPEERAEGDNRTMLLWFNNNGDYRDPPFDRIYSGRILYDIADHWIPMINDGDIHIIVSTWGESHGPNYENEFNAIETEDIHANLLKIAEYREIKPERITWITGDLNAQEYLKDSKINVLSHCVFFHSIVGEVESYGYENFYNKGNDISKTFIFPNRFIKPHRAYVLSRIWEMRQDPMQFDELNYETTEGYTDENDERHYSILWSCPKTLYGSNIADAYRDLMFYAKTYPDLFDRKRQINWHSLRDYMLDMYFYLPFEIDAIDKENDSCTNLDAMLSIQPYYHKSAFGIVSETRAEGRKLFISDATVSALLHGIPFLVLGNRGTIAKLKEWGFKTFDDYFDESYDDIVDDVERWNAIVEQIRFVLRQPKADVVAQRKAMQEIVEHNYKHLWYTSIQHEKDLIKYLSSL